MKLNYVSLFSGIEAFSVAASRIRDVEWNPVFLSEIDPFCCTVLSERLPSVPNLGDVTKIKVVENPETKQKEITNGTTTIPFPGGGIDVLAGGSPCQGFSVAGKRLGLDDPRSGLAMHYARLVDELRPRVLFYENVPGMLSSAGGLDFYAFVRTLAELGYADLSYRTLDCQYVTVDGFPNAIPQRRRRVFLVGVRSVGHSRTDVPASAQILFEPAGLLGIDPPRREKGKGFACPAGYVVAGDDRDVESGGGGAGNAASVGNGQLNQTTPESVAKCLDAMHDAQMAVTPVCVGKEGYNIGEAGQGSMNISEDDSAQTVRADTHPSAVATGTAFGKVSHARNKEMDGERYEEVGVAQTRNTFDNGESRAQELVVSPLVCKTLTAEGFDGAPDVQKGNGMPVVATGFSHSNSDLSLLTKPTPECAMTIRSAHNGEGAAVISVDRYNQTTAVEAMHTLKTNAQTGDGGPCIAVAIDGDKILKAERRGGSGVGWNENDVGCTETSNDRHAVATMTAIGFKAGQSANGGLGDEEEVCPTQSHQPSALEPTVAIGINSPQAHSTTRGFGVDVQPTFGAAAGESGNNRPMVAVGCDRRNQAGSDEVQPALQSTVSDGGSTVAVGFDTYNGVVTGEVGRTLNSAATDTDHLPVVLHRVVRRLTPVECSRLQGFPDWWLRVPMGRLRKIEKDEYDYLVGIPGSDKHLRTPANSLRGCYETDWPPDSSMYKALGNSWATNCAEWILRRIVAALRLGMIPEAEE